jgi:hypothetical protein
METIRLTTVIGNDRKLRIEADTQVDPGPAEVVLVVIPAHGLPAASTWRELVGLGKEIWKGEDAQGYVNRLRDEWER